MKKVFSDHGLAGGERQVCGWVVGDNAAQLTVMQEGYVPEAGEVTIVVSHHIYVRLEETKLTKVWQAAKDSGGAFFFVYASRSGPDRLRNRHKPDSGIFACHAQALPTDCVALLTGQSSSLLGIAIAAINDIASAMPVAEQAQEVRRILDKINGSAADDEDFYSAVAMLLVCKALESGSVESGQTPALKTWIDNQSNSTETVAQLESKVLNHFRPAG